VSERRLGPEGAKYAHKLPLLLPHKLAALFRKVGEKDTIPARGGTGIDGDPENVGLDGRREAKEL
jgi:hypothetical protein